MTPAPAADLLAEVVARGRAAWRGVDVAPAQVAAYLAALPAPPQPAHAADVYLACACAAGNAAALAHFDAAIVRNVPGFVRHLGGRDFGDEVRQQVRTRLLTSDGGPPRIASYAGRGSLGGWVRAAAIRIALDQRRAHEPASMARERAAELLVSDHDPALAFLKAHHREVFQDALHEALAGLSERDRTVLRLHVCGGLSAVRIGALLGVNHATISRWLITARTTIFLETRRRLTARLRLSSTEFESLVRLVQSQLDLHLSRVLAPADAGT